MLQRLVHKLGEDPRCRGQIIWQASKLIKGSVKSLNDRVSLSIFCAGDLLVESNKHP